GDRVPDGDRRVGEVVLDDEALVAVDAEHAAGLDGPGAAPVDLAAEEDVLAHATGNVLVVGALVGQQHPAVGTGTRRGDVRVDEVVADLDVVAAVADDGGRVAGAAERPVD